MDALHRLRRILRSGASLNERIVRSRLQFNRGGLDLEQALKRFRKSEEPLLEFRQQAGFKLRCDWTGYDGLLRVVRYEPVEDDPTRRCRLSDVVAGDD